MKRALVIQKTTQLLTALSDEQLKEAADFVSFLHERQRKGEFQNEIQKLVELSGAFDFLDSDECIYTLDDIIEKY
jgi:hypothetical protein